MFVDVDNDTGLPVKNPTSGHQTISDLKGQGFTVILTSRGVPCTEIHHNEPFSAVYPDKGIVTVADRIDSDYQGVISKYRLVFADYLDDEDRVGFDLVFDKNMPGRGFDSITRRVWDSENRTWKMSDVTIGNKAQHNQATPGM